MGELHNLRRGIRNIWRSKVRTIVVALMAGTALALAITMLAMQSGIEQQVQSMTASLGTTISINPAGSFGGFGRGEPMDQTLLADVAAQEHVQTVSEYVMGVLPGSSTNLNQNGAGGGLGKQRRVPFNGQFVFGTNEVGSLSLMGMAATLSAGRAFTTEDLSGGTVILGQQIIDDKGLSLGDTYQVGGKDLTIIGVLPSGNNRFIGSAIVLPLSIAQGVLDMSGQISQASVTADNLANVDSVVAALQEKLGEAADVVSQKDQQLQRAEQSLGTVQSSMRTGLIVTLAAAGMVIFFTMLLVVRERTREVGVLKVLGASALDLISGFAYEAVALALLACVVGSLLFAFGGNAIAKTVVAGTVQMQSGGAGQAPTGGLPAGQQGGLGRRFNLAGGRLTSALGGLDVELRLADLYKIALASVGLGLLGSLLPALYAVRLKPAEVLRNE